MNYFTLASEKDSSGIYGGIFGYAIVFLIVGISLLTFLYLWKKNSLDMDEEPKLRMMQDNDEEIHGH